MFLRVAKLIVGCLSIAGDIWTIVRWADKSGLTSDMTLGPPEYAAILTIWTGLLVWSAARPLKRIFNWWLRTYTDRGQFAAMAVEIGDLEKQFRTVAGDAFVKPNDSKAWAVLSEKLSALQAFAPKDWTNSSASSWLGHIRLYAERGNLDDARRFSDPTIERNNYQ